MGGGRDWPGRAGQVPARDDAQRRFEDLSRDPQASAQDDPSGFGVLFGESCDVPHLRPTERVDRLVGVAGRGEIAVGQGHQTCDLGLDGRGVLILVDEHMTELRRQVLARWAAEEIDS